MGAPKQKWSSEEEEALRAGIAKHGTGKWKNIQKDPDFNNVLSNRSNIDLKDKWRNMSVSAGGQGSREKTKTPKPKAFLPPPSNSVTASPLPLAVQDPSANQDLVLYSSTKNPSVPKNPHRFTTMIIDALESMKDPNGSDADSIMSFIERKYEVNFRNNLGQKLNRLANQDRIEKVHGRSGYFRAKEDGALGALGKKASTSAPKLHDHSQRQSEQTPTAIDSLESEFEEAAKTAAYMIADAENKVFLALKAVEEAERVAKEAAESDSMLQLAIEIFQRCSRGEIVLMA